jgi:protein-tyrosine phosphatase
VTAHGITHVTVEREGADLVVRWEGTVDGPVAVCAGLRPDAIDHTRPLAVVADGSDVRLPGLGTGARHYVHVGPQRRDAAPGELRAGIVAAERLVPLEGTLNFRDLGGYATADGRRVKWGRLFRSDGLHGLTDADHGLLASIGLRSVYDLRWAREREAQPSRLPADGVTVHHVSIGQDPTGDDFMAQIFSGEITEVGIDWMIDTYRQMVDEGATAFARLLAHLAEPAALPAVFHCSAGKDRTGLSAALLLRLLGVPDEVVLDDYELSTTYRSDRRVEELRPRFEEAGLDIDRFRNYLSAPRPALVAALEHIDGAAGGVEGYLRAGGMASDVPEHLRELLLER